MLPAQTARGGARTLELQSRCPFRAQAEIRLRAQPYLASASASSLSIVARCCIVCWKTCGERFGVSTHCCRSVLLTLRPWFAKPRSRHAAQALQTDTRHRSRLATLEIESVTGQVMQLLDLEKQRPPFTVQLRGSRRASTKSAGCASLCGPTASMSSRAAASCSSTTSLASHIASGTGSTCFPGRPRRPQLPLYGLAHGEQLRALAYVVVAPGTVEYRGWSDGTAVAAGVVPYPEWNAHRLRRSGGLAVLDAAMAIHDDAARTALCGGRRAGRSVAAGMRDLSPEHVVPDA